MRESIQELLHCYKHSVHHMCPWVYIQSGNLAHKNSLRISLPEKKTSYANFNVISHYLHITHLQDSGDATRRLHYSRLKTVTKSGLQYLLGQCKAQPFNSDGVCFFQCPNTWYFKAMRSYLEPFPVCMQVMQIEPWYAKATGTIPKIAKISRLFQCWN